MVALICIHIMSVGKGYAKFLDPSSEQPGTAAEFTNEHDT